MQNFGGTTKSIMVFLKMAYMLGVRVNENIWGAQILQFFRFFVIKQLFHSRSLDMR